MLMPLEGVVVVEFGGNVAGPYAGMILAELGAEVIKVERPTGDDARAWGPPFVDESSTLFHSINRNKKSVVADFKDADTVARLKALILTKADVVLQNMRAGALEKIGLGADALLAEKPDLVYCNLGAFGRTGPLAKEPGYDGLMQAYGGIVSVTGEEGANPVRCGISVLDQGSAMWCVIGILAALRNKDRAGKGGKVESSLFETALAWNAIYLADYQVTGKNPKKLGTGTRNITPYQAYECSDGHLIVAAPNDRLFAILADLLGHAEWKEDERFATSPARAENNQILNPLIHGVMRHETRAHWRALLNERGIPNAPIQTIDEVLKDEQTQALDFLQETDQADLRLGGLPISFDGERPPLNTMAPKLGAHTKDILDEAD